MKAQITPFAEEHLPAAGRLLAQRHCANRARFPLLPARFEDPETAVKAVAALWQKKFKSGYAAFRGGHLVAYLLGDAYVQPWARCGYVYLPGYALAAGESPALIQDLYARLGENWVRRGIFSHGLYVSAAEPALVEALFDLGFGKERVDALLDLRALDIPAVQLPAGVTIRQAVPGDNALIGGFSDRIFRALAEAPYWHPTPPEEWDELLEGWSELPDDAEWALWMAMEGEAPLAMNGFVALEEADTDLLAAPKTIELSIAATHPGARGRGLGTALGWHGLRQAREAGYELCYSNWISPNLLASRHWPRYGFQDVAYRLAKRVDPQITWTRG
ncbi:MAG: GNAT family N-acetyltransferase [Chloroflexota bacterium]